MSQADSQQIVEARTQFARYLSDEIAPMIFADAAEVLFNAPPEVLAREIHSWIGLQLQGPRASAISDYLLHSARKVFHLGELELLPKEELREYMAKLHPLLVGMAPEHDRAELATNLDQLGISENESMASRISVSRSPSGGGGGGGGLGPGAPGSGAQSGSDGTRTHAAEQIQPPPNAPPEATHPNAAQASTTSSEQQTAANIDRLNLLLDRWERVATTTGSRSSAPAAPSPSPAGAEGAILSRIIDEIATSARSTADLDNQLRYLKDLGVESLGAGDVLRALSAALPDWAPAHEPRAEGDQVPTLSGAAETMRKVVDLAKDPAELNDRFRELVTTTVDEFNSGSIGRAVTVIDLAKRMISEHEVDASLAANMIDQASEQLDDSQLRRYAENDDKRLLLRRALRFFPSTQVDNLMGDLVIEERRDRRRFILKLLMTHGEEARNKAIEVLREALSGNVPQPWFVQRNLIYLMRSIDPSEDSDIEKEIDLLVRASVPGGELPLLREALTALGHIDHPRSVQTLTARVSDLEDVLSQKSNAVHNPGEIQSLLDTAIKGLIRFNTAEARQCVLRHGLRKRPEFGDTLARLAMLGGQDLAQDPSTVNQIIEAIKVELPVKVFGVSVKTSRKTHNISHLLESLSGTDVPRVRTVYDSIVRKFPGERFANAAARFLTKLDTKTSIDEPDDEDETINSLSGDLALFGLPNLMQNLADSRVEGVLTVLDNTGSSSASISLRDGMLTDASAGELAGDVAVYQLLERPIVGRFIFVNQPVDVGEKEGEPGGIPVMSLLMEGMRRYDEFNRATAIIQDEARFGATGQQPTALPDEDDADFVNGIWVQATQGATPVEIERTAKVDGYRIFRLFEHWVDEGSLEPKTEVTADS